MEVKGYSQYMVRIACSVDRPENDMIHTGSQQNLCLPPAGVFLGPIYTVYT